jgi:hypothetical protein
MEGREYISYSFTHADCVEITSVLQKCSRLICVSSCFLQNIAFVLEVVFFFAHILIYHRTTHDWWQALLGVAIVSPLFIAPLYVMPICRDVFVRAYAMAPSDIHSSDTSKPLICEIV